MKFKKIITTIIILIIIINIKSVCFAKYVFDYTQKAVHLEIDRTPPILKIEYSNKELTNTDVEVRIISNEEIQEVEGWKLLENKKTLVKTYSKNDVGTIEVKDISGNTSEAQIIVNNIDKLCPEVKIIETNNTNKGYEKYANRTHQIDLKIKVFDENDIISHLKQFEVLIEGSKSICQNETSIIEKGKNYIIYNVKLINITENGKLSLKVLKDSFEDMAGNKNNEITLDTGITIDNIAPTATYNQIKDENGKILAKITSNEVIRNVEGWNLDKSKKISSKEFISDIKYKREVTDLAGNTTTVEIKVEGSTFLGLECIAHISNIGWTETKDNFVGTTKKGNGYKIEGLILRTSEKVEKDFLKASAYAYTYWGEGTSAKSNQFGMEYSYGYNPVSGYKTLENSELVTYNNKRYIHLGGEGINFHGTTDINGRNPIPIEVANQHKYGISGIKLELKQNNENSIIYQIYFRDIGWQKTCKNGEEAMKAKNKTIECIKIAIVPSSEAKFVIQDWDKNIGLLNFN